MMDRLPSDFLRSLNAEQRRVASQGWPYVLAFAVLNSAACLYVDLYHWDEERLHPWVAFFSWALGYMLFLGLMKTAGYLANGKASGVGTYFALGLVTSIAIIPALIVFLVPGLYLLMRWLPAYSRALTAPEWITQSLRWSWTVTQPVQKSLALALAGPVLLYGIAMVAGYLYEFELGLSYETSMVIVNLATTAAVIWLTVLGNATFGLLSKSKLPQQGLQPVTKPA